MILKIVRRSEFVGCSGGLTILQIPVSNKVAVAGA